MSSLSSSRLPTPTPPAVNTTPLQKYASFALTLRRYIPFSSSPFSPAASKGQARRGYTLGINGDYAFEPRAFASPLQPGDMRLHLVSDGCVVRHGTLLAVTSERLPRPLTSWNDDSGVIDTPFGHLIHLRRSAGAELLISSFFSVSPSPADS